MAITTVNDIASGLASSQKINFCKNIAVPKAIGSFQSSWLVAGYPGAGAIPNIYTSGSSYTCDNTNVGAFPYSNAVTQNYLAKLFMSSVVPGTLILADRLWSCSGMGFASGTYTVTTPGNLPARITDNGLGCELWVEQFVAAGASTAILTANYLDVSGTSRQGIINPVVSSPLIGQMQPVPFAAGNYGGIKQLTSVNTSSTWTSGSWGMTILKRIAEIQLPLAGVGNTLDWAALGLPTIPASACLMLIFQGGAATASQVIGRLTIIDK